MLVFTYYVRKWGLFMPWSDWIIVVGVVLLLACLVSIYNLEHMLYRRGHTWVRRFMDGVTDVILVVANIWVYGLMVLALIALVALIVVF